MERPWRRDSHFERVHRHCIRELRITLSSRCSYRPERQVVRAKFIELIDKFDLASGCFCSSELPQRKRAIWRGTRINAFLGVFDFYSWFSQSGFSTASSPAVRKQNGPRPNRRNFCVDSGSCSDAVIVADTSGKIIYGTRSDALQRGAPAQEIARNILNY